MLISKRRRSGTRRHWKMAFAALALAGFAGACVTSTSTSATTTTTESFSGTIKPGGGAYHTFTVTQAGTVSATLTSLSPQTTIQMGLGIGTVTGAVCTLVSYASNVTIGGAVQAATGTAQGTVSVGSCCVMIFDVGNVEDSDDYAITVAHP